MSGYSNVMRNVDLYGNILNKGLADFGTASNRLGDVDDDTIYGRTTPNIGPSTFLTSSSRNIYGNQVPNVFNPMSLYQDDEGNWSKPNLLTRGLGGLQGMQTGQMLTKLGDKAAPSISKLLGGTGEVAPIGPGLTGGMMLKRLTDDQNPYTYSGTERLGDIGGNIMMARSLAPALGLAATKGAALSGAAAGAAATGLPLGVAAPLFGPTAGAGAGILGMHPALALGALGLSLFMGRRKKKKAKQLKQKAIDEVTTAQREGYEKREDKIMDVRDQSMQDASQRQWEQSQSRYSNQYGGAYAEEGMKFTPKELKKIAKAGRNGDTMLAHINPQEAALLKAMGGSGTINPYTGQPEYFRRFFRGLGNILGGVGKGVRDITDPIVKTIAEPVFDAAGSVIDPIGGAVSDVVGTAGDVLSEGIDKGLGLTRDVMELGQDLSSDLGKGVTDIVNPVLDPIMSKGMDIVKPVMEGIHGAVEPVMAGTTDVFGNVIEGGLDLTKKIGHDVLIPAARGLLSIPGEILGGIFGGGQQGGLDFGIGDPTTLQQKRQAMTKDPEMHPLELSGIQQSGVSGMKDQDIAELYASDFRGDLENPFIRENVMQMNKGGKINTVAEFTGNELIVNNQNDVEKGLSIGNYSMAAAPIRRAMNEGYITPGEETHKGNPLPVDEKGNIYAGGGVLPFKVNKGAGVYDHATDQFSPTMTDKEIAMVAKKNIAKWKKNKMY